MFGQGVSLRRYVARRTAQTIPLVIGVIVINFTLIHLAPGDPVVIIAGEQATPERIEFLRSHFGLDKPLYEQLFVYIWNVLNGDLGYSISYQRPVIHLIMERLPNTLLLMFPSFVISSLLGIYLGMISARKPYSTVDNATTIFSLIAYCLPVFWLAQILILFFSLQIGWFPVAGISSARLQLAGIDYILDVLRHLFLPTVTLSAINLALISRLTRANLLEVLKLDFVTTARMKGLSEESVIRKHVLQNAMLPVVTVIGMNLVMVFAGAILTETVFGWPGLGRLTYEAIYARDYPTLLGMFVVVSFAVILTNLVTDVVYAFLDPRIRYK